MRVGGGDEGVGEGGGGEGRVTKVVVIVMTWIVYSDGDETCGGGD